MQTPLQYTTNVSLVAKFSMEQDSFAKTQDAEADSWFQQYSETRWTSVKAFKTPSGVSCVGTCMLDITTHLSFPHGTADE
jgi:hypothetical protein